ncbi:hypothetical protein BOX15_Mlig008808g1 [Macrostomum lignano]|uniref:WSC domain-containing protein n=1 Tax=Macrostomum lignano TaxID=282301 RepID=A0A267EY41_9PLAT|nr:hypothetical protein BOX15_Mlig008808g1 [Macrostomum lignano]
MLLAYPQLLLLLLQLAPGPVRGEFWDSEFVNKLYSFVRYKGYFVSLFQHATKPDHFFYTPLVLLDKESGQSFYNYLRGVQEVDFTVLMSTDGLRAEVLQHLVADKRVNSPHVQLIPMETVRFTFASALRRGSMKLDLETTAVPNNHLPNSLPIKFYSFGQSEARKFMAAVREHPAILDQLVLEYTITQQRSAEKQVEIKAEYIASTALFAKLTTMTAPGTVRYLTAHDANAIASQSYSSIRARVVRSQEYIEGPDEVRLTELIQQLLTRNAATWSQLNEAARQSVFWDPTFARPDEVSHLLNRVYERESGTDRRLKVSEDQRQLLETQSAQSTACYIFKCEGDSSESSRRLDTRQRLTEEEMKQFLNERQLEVEYTGRLFVVKNMKLFRVNTAEFQSGQTIATSSVQVTKKQELHTLKLKTDPELPGDSTAVSRAACPSAPYTYKGCYEDSATAPDLNGFNYQSADMKASQCYKQCSGRGFAYFGLQSGDRCSCGAAVGRYQMRPDSECADACAGDAGQRCGGRLRNSVFAVDRPAASSASTSSSTAHPDNVYNSTKFEYRGCYEDFGDLATDSSRQPWLTQRSDRMTVEACHHFCAGGPRQQQPWFLLRAGAECHCRRRLPHGGQLKRLSDADCRQSCSGNQRQACGGGGSSGGGKAAVSIYAAASLRQSVVSPGGGGFGPDWSFQLSAASSAASSPASSASSSSGGYSELGCPAAGGDAFLETSALQTPGLTPNDCLEFCRADDTTTKYFRIGRGGGGGLFDGFGGDFGFGRGGSGGLSSSDPACSCLFTMMPESRIRFGSGRSGDCSGFKYFAIVGR